MDNLLLLSLVCLIWMKKLTEMNYFDWSQTTSDKKTVCLDPGLRFIYSLLELIRIQKDTLEYFVLIVHQTEIVDQTKTVNRMCSVKFCKVHKYALALEFSLSKVAGKAVAQRCFKKKFHNTFHAALFFMDSYLCLSLQLY